MDNSQLTGRVARSAAWVLGGGVFARLLGALNTIIVARLLAPDDIGIVAVATVTMQLLQGFSDIGVSQAVVKFRDAGRADLDTLFTLSAIRGAVIALALIAAGPFMAALYDDPRMAGVFFGVALFPLLTGFLNPSFYEYERDLNFSREFLSTVANKLAGVIVSVSVALIFRTYWAIILGLVVGGAVQLGLSYLMRPYAPRFSLRSIKKVFGFSGWLAGVSFLAALNNKLDVPILARLVGPAGAGSYFIGLQLSEMTTGQIAGPLIRAIYPGFSQLQGDAERMRKAYLKGVSALGVLAMPAAFGAAFVAQDLVLVLLGAQWVEATDVIRFLAPVIGLQALFYATQAYAMALGRTKLIFFRELIFLLVRLPVFIWATATYGLSGAIWAAAVLGLFHVALNLALYSRCSGRSFWQPLASAYRPILSVAAMAAYFLLFRPLYPDSDDYSVVLSLMLDVVLGAVFYIGALAGLWVTAGKPPGIERDFINFVLKYGRKQIPLKD